MALLGCSTLGQCDFRKKGQGQPTPLSEYAFVIPFSMILSVLHGIHCSPFSGHLGLNRTLHRARGKFFWPKLSLHITEFVRSCHFCAQSKLGAPQRRAPFAAH